MTREEAEREMLDGYMDGFDLANPDPSGNRSLSYMHGFRNGRADKTGTLTGYSCDELRKRAEHAILGDVHTYNF